MPNVEKIRQAGLAKVRECAFEEAVELFDQALALAIDEGMIELLMINKAGALIDMDKDGPELQKLPQFVMRRRSPTHTFLAAIHLLTMYSRARDFKRAYAYGRIAIEASDHVEERWWKVAAINDMGSACVLDSRLPEAIAHYREALRLLEPTDEFARSRGYAMENLGYCLLHEGEVDEGIVLIHQAIVLMTRSGAPASLAAEGYIDLCYGYLEHDRLVEARQCGEAGLALAGELRQIRNAHYLLGEVAYKLGDLDGATSHFEHLARHYPQFPQLTNVLTAIDLRRVVNLKL